jgi:putative serine protease PepD
MVAVNEGGKTMLERLRERTSGQPGGGRRVLLPLAALLAAGLLGGLAGAGILTALDDDGGGSGTATVTVEAAPDSTPTSSVTPAVSELYKQSISGVVEVISGGDSDSVFGPEETSSGSGFVIDGEGRVVTNQHVVGGADEVTVRFHDGTEAPARVVGSDPSTDIALIDLDEVPADVEPLPLGSSESLEVGDPVIALGSPFGLEGTVTAGIVSGLDRQIQAPDGFTIDGVIQTDAALNSGNSGGPLIDSAGRVVGVNSQIESRTGGNVGIGYAVPIDTAKEVVDDLRTGGEVEHAYLGVRLSDAESGDGARIVDVVDGAPADEAGLEAGDVVVSAGGEAVDSGDDLRRAVSERDPGDELELEVRRDGDTETVTVELGRRPT